MLDTGAEPNLIRKGSLNDDIFIDNRETILTGITENVVDTLGTIEAIISQTPVVFHVVPDDFPIVAQGILGSLFFSEHRARINYDTNQITWHGNTFNFKTGETIVLPPRSKFGFMIRVSNPEIKTGYLLQLYACKGIYAGDCLITCINNKAYIKVTNSLEREVEMFVPTVELREVDQVTHKPRCNNAETVVKSKDSHLKNAIHTETIKGDKNESSRYAESQNNSLPLPNTNQSRIRDEGISKVHDKQRPMRKMSINVTKPQNSIDATTMFAYVNHMKTHESPSLPTKSNFNSKSTPLIEGSFSKGAIATTYLHEGSSNSISTLPVSNTQGQLPLEDLDWHPPFTLDLLDMPTHSQAIITSPVGESNLTLKGKVVDSNVTCKVQSLDRENNSCNSTVDKDCDSDKTTRILQLLRLDHLNEPERESIVNLVKQYNDRFYLPGDPLGKTKLYSHRIITKDDVPVNTKQYRFPPVHRDEVTKQVNQLLNRDIIEASISPYNSPIWIVPKKPDPQGVKRWRLVVDFRKLNEKTIGRSYPLPNICEILDQLGSAKYFTVLDLASGFHQIPMDPRDAHKTAFSTPRGHFQFKRMPFGLKNAPADFQNFIDILMDGLLGYDIF